MSKEVIVALDQGTTSSRAIVFNKNGEIQSIAQKEFKQHFPQSGWVEHDPKDLWSTQIAVLSEVIAKAKIQSKNIKAIGITNQRETTIVWDKKTGDPIYNAIVWQDRRTAEYCQSLIKAGHDEVIREKTGLRIDSYFSATKIHWILENVKGARQKAEKGELAFGTVDSWLVWNLTDGATFITDVTNASRTMLMNLHTLEWDDDLLKIFDIPKSMLPEIKSSSEVYGETAGQILQAQIPIAGIAGDQQAALFGQLCVQKGMVKNTYGTGCFLLMNIGEKPILSKNNLVTSVGWKIGDSVQYVLEGSVFIAGAVVQWLRDGLGIIKKSADIEKLSASVEDNNGVYIVPAFAGIGAPYWNADARGTIVGLSRGSTAGHLARASLESIAFQTYDIIKAMEIDAKLKIEELRVDGGAANNDFLMQFQANLLDNHVIRPKITETTAQGAAYLAGLAVGFWESIEEIQEKQAVDKTFKSDPDFNSKDVYKNWQRAIKTTIFWAENK